MEIVLSRQAALLGQSLAFGAGLAVLYDLLRPIRRGRPRLTALTDGLYCLTALLAIFLFLLRPGKGELRLDTICGIAGGAMAWVCLLSPLLRPVWDFWAETVSAAAHLASIPFRILWYFYKKFALHCKKLFYFVKKYATMKKNRRIPAKSHADRRALAVKRGQEVKTATKSAAKPAAKKAKRRTKASFFTKLLVLALLLALGWQLHSLQKQLTAAELQRQQLSTQVTQQQQSNDVLQQRIASGGSDEEMQKIARDELGLVFSNEKIFYATGN